MDRKCACLHLCTNTKMSCPHHMPLHTQETKKKGGKKGQFVCDLVKTSRAGGACFFF